VKQGEVYSVDLDPVIGLEIGGNQLVVIVSNNAVIGSILPVTVALVRDAATSPLVRVTGVSVPAAESGLGIDVIVDCLQLRTLDQSRFPTPPAGSLLTSKEPFQKCSVALTSAESGKQPSGF
jgi:mRNA interferase MazF